MIDPQLQREEAIQLITPVVDGEAEEDNARAFFHYIEHDLEVKRRFEEEKWIKHLVQDQLPRYDAPFHLREKVQHVLEEAKNRYRDSPTSTSSILHSGNDAKRSTRSSSSKKGPVPSGVSGYLLITFIGLLLTIWLFLYHYTDYSFEVNELAYKHYTLQRGSYLNFLQGNFPHSEIRFRSSSQTPFRIPEFQGATLAGIFSHLIVEDYSIPLIIHKIPSNDSVPQTIYTFVFNVNDLKENPQLYRSTRSIQEATQKGRYFSQQIDGRFVTSWQKDNYWYISVSKQSSRKLVTMGDITNQPNPSTIPHQPFK